MNPFPASFTALCIIGWIIVASSAAAQTWQATLPASARELTLWYADVEDGTLRQWTDADFKSHGGGVFNTGGEQAVARASQDVVHTGRWSAEATIRGAFRAQHGKRAVRLMRWTNRAWDDQGEFFPNEAFYSTWLYFPHAYDPRKSPPWDPGDGGWWNIFEFKGHDRQGQSQPIWTINVDYNGRDQTMYLYLYSKQNQPSSHQQPIRRPLPLRKWVHLEALYKSATDASGRLTLWQDGHQIFDVRDVVTSLGGKTGTDTHAIWGIGNYTDHIIGDPAEDGTATVYFDDAAVSLIRLSQFLPALDVARP